MRIAPSIAAAAALCAACVTPAPSSSAWAPGSPREPSAAPARVLLVAEPAGAEEIGVVEAHGPRPGVPLQGTETYTETEVRTVTKVDPDGTPRTETEVVTVTKEKDRECTGTRMVEAAVLSLVGRAFRTQGGPP